MTQRIASVWRRLERTSTGTWYVAPPTRRDFTSTIGLTLSSAMVRSSIAWSDGRPVRSAILSIAPYTIRSATDFLPRSMIMFMNLASSTLLNLGSGRMLRVGAAALRDMGSSALPGVYALARKATWIA
jgi:hypothetical protein